MSHRHAQQRRRHLRQEARHAGVRPGRTQQRRAQPDVRQNPDAAQRRHLDRQLQHTAQQHAGGQRVDRLQPPAPELRRQPPAGSDHRQVEQHRRGRRHGKALPRVQNAGRQRHQRDETDVGKHPARHQHRRVELLQAGGHQPHDDRRRHHAQRTGQGQGPEQHGGHRIDQRARCGVAVAGTCRRQDGHESLRKRTFAEQPAQQIGNAEGDVVGVGQGAGAEHRRHHDLARQPGDARGQREQRNGGGGAQQVHERRGAARARVGQAAHRPRGATGRPDYREPSATSAPTKGDGSCALLYLKASFPPRPSSAWPPPPKPRKKPFALLRA